MAKYKPGDKVRVRKDLKPHEYYSMASNCCSDVATEPMCRFAGEVVTILSVSECTGKYKIKEDQRFYWTDGMLKPVETQPIVIYRNGQEVIAHDRNTGEMGKAKCSPEDEFDFYIGADLAYKRLREKWTEPNHRVGDILIGLPDASKLYGITKEGWLGIVKRVNERGNLDLRGLCFDGTHFVTYPDLQPSCFRLAADEEITVDWVNTLYEDLIDRH